MTPAGPKPGNLVRIKPETQKVKLPKFSNLSPWLPETIQHLNRQLYPSR